MTIFKDESGRVFRVNTGVDMSGYSSLSLLFTDPDGVTTTKTIADGVSLGTSSIVDPDIGSLTANQYIRYTVEVGLFSKAGRWCVQALYTNTGAEPDDNLYGEIARFIVKERC